VGDCPQGGDDVLVAERPAEFLSTSGGPFCGVSADERSCAADTADVTPG
jgi:hypothetical protein